MRRYSIVPRAGLPWQTGLWKGMRFFEPERTLAGSITRIKKEDAHSTTFCQETAMRFYRAVSSASFCACLFAALGPVARAADVPAARTEDVIYGRKFGMALTLDVFTPRENANGAAVVAVVSGGWFSSHDHVNIGLANALTKRGYTVFEVVHGSQPRFTIPDAVADLNRAVRFIRYHAKDYHIDPPRIGITGGSAGGHLSLMQGTAGDTGDPKAKDPVDRMSSRVQAVACFFPPTDFLNYGEKGKSVLESVVVTKHKLRSPFDFQEFNRDRQLFVPITDEQKVREILRQCSPFAHASSDDPPTLIIHGDKDSIVPLQQAEAIITRFKEVGVPAELIVKKGADHGWPGMDRDLEKCVDWFDRYLAPKK
jgi:acetyl esterase/lipase